MLLPFLAPGRGRPRLATAPGAFAAADPLGLAGGPASAGAPREARAGIAIGAWTLAPLAASGFAGAGNFAAQRVGPIVHCRLFGRGIILVHPVQSVRLGAFEKPARPTEVWATSVS